MSADAEEHSSSWRRVRSTVLIGLGCSVLLGLIQSVNIYWMRLNAPSVHFTWAMTLLRTLPAWLVVGAAAPLIAEAARRYAFEPGGRLVSASVHMALAIGFGLVHLAVMGATYTLSGTGAATLAGLERSFFVAFRYLFVWEILSYWALVGVFLVVHYSNVRRSLAEARLSALRMQLNPHFLFNALNAVSSQALRGDVSAVSETVGRLSDLLRASLDGSSQEIPLDQELEFLDSYMAIQQVRFADRLRLEKHIEPEVRRALVPRMLLQPLVENAVTHGLAAPGEATTVAVDASRRDDRLVINVKDTGPGFPHGVLREGIGLANTRARLEALYGFGHQFELSTATGGGALVRVVVPFRKGVL